MPTEEGVYGSSVDQSGKATGRVQGAGQGDPSPASCTLAAGVESTANQSCRRARQSSVAGQGTSDTMASFEETRYWPPCFSGCTQLQHRIVPVCLAPPCSTQVKPPLGKSDIFDAWPLLHKGKRGRGGGVGEAFYEMETIRCQTQARRTQAPKHIGRHSRADGRRVLRAGTGSTSDSLAAEGLPACLYYALALHIAQTTPTGSWASRWRPLEAHHEITRWIARPIPSRH